MPRNSCFINIIQGINSGHSKLREFFGLFFLFLEKHNFSVYHLLKKGFDNVKYLRYLHRLLIIISPKTYAKAPINITFLLAKIRGHASN